MSRILLAILIPLLQLGAVCCFGQDLCNNPKTVNRKEARQLAAGAAEEAAHISKAEEKADAYLSLGKAQTEIGDTPAARKSLATAETITDAISQSLANTKEMERHVFRLYSQIINARAALGDIDKARSIVEKLDHNFGKCAALCQIAEAQLNAKNTKGAIETLGKAKNAFDKRTSNYHGNIDILCIDMVSTWTEAGEIEEAKSFIDKIAGDHLYLRANCYDFIAKAHAKAGNMNEAFKTLELTEEMRARIKSNELGWYINHLSLELYGEIAEIQAKTGDVEGAEKTLSRMQDAVRKNTKNSPKAYHKLAEDGVFMTRGQIQLEIASRKTTAGKSNEARRCRERAMESFLEINSPWLRTLCLLSIFESQMKADDLAPARSTMAKAKNATETIENTCEKVSSYCYIANAQSKASDYASAKESIEAALTCIPEIIVDYKLWQAYYEIAVAQANAGDIAGAKATAKNITSEITRNKVYPSIVASLSESGDAPGAIEYCKQVLTDPAKRCKCLTDAAVRLCEEP